MEREWKNEIWLYLHEIQISHYLKDDMHLFRIIVIKIIQNYIYLAEVDGFFQGAEVLRASPPGGNLTVGPEIKELQALQITSSLRT